MQETSAAAADGEAVLQPGDDGHKDDDDDVQEISAAAAGGEAVLQPGDDDHKDDDVQEISASCGSWWRSCTTTRRAST